MREALDALLTIVVSPACAACGELLDHPTRGPVCVSCWQSIRPLTPPLCDRCGDPLPSWRTISAALQRCPRCRRTEPHLDRARAIGEYDGALRAIVQALKYEGRRSLARPLAALMCARGGDVLNGAVCLVPVPLHSSKRRQRGFNQAADLARHFELPVVFALTRIRATRSQTALPALLRRRNLKDAFAATRHAAALAGSCVVLIDDVCTTGATLEECARVLKESGVREVRALTAARVVASAATSSARTNRRRATGPRSR